MLHYQGPRFKKIRRLGALPGLTSKRPRAGSDLRNQLHFGKKSQYRICLEEKQKLRFHYARQLVNRRQILVNGCIVDIPSYRCKSRDVITEVPKHLTLHPFQYKGLVNQIIDSKWIGLKINELLVVEYYSC
ncbi:hypothetical protein BT93_F2162 [Corymbia citriodora subsp. variegata]|nr:hypothetical protein BT93_F2162 [Corymbia citriodora subsp. variegata]